MWPKDGFSKILCACGTLLFAIGTAHAGDYLYGGTQLNPGQSIVSAQSKYSLIMQSDGSLVMYRNDGYVRWRGEKNGWIAAMQSDGNFVEYNGAMSPIFNTGTGGNPGAFLHIQDDGNLVVYSSNIQALWNIGAEPSPTDAKLPADVVGRDLDSPVGGFIGHLGVYDGSGNVIEAENSSPNSLRVITYNQFKGTTHNFWGAASPAIPTGLATWQCYRTYCPQNGEYNEQLEMRMAIVKTAYQQQLIGASYTLTAQWQFAEYADEYYPAKRGIYRCDTFIIGSLYYSHKYAVASTARNNWTNFVDVTFAQGGSNGPSGLFARLKSYK